MSDSEEGRWRRPEPMGDMEIGELAQHMLAGRIVNAATVDAPIQCVFLPFAFGALQGVPLEELRGVECYAVDGVDAAWGRGARSFNGYPIFTSMRFCLTADWNAAVERYKAARALLGVEVSGG